jgi:predicted RNase H-like HicB family nuclease
MQSERAFTYWEDRGMWLGYLDEFPEYMTQGSSLDDLREHLLDIHKEIASGNIPTVSRQHATFEVA